MIKKQIFLSILILFSIIGLYAQVTTSALTGMVTDENNEPLAGATVVAVHTPTGTEYGAITQFSGKYSIRNMKIGGPYTVTFSYVGYQKQKFENIYLQLGQTFNLNAKLTPASQELEAVVIQVKKNNTFNTGRTGAETSLGRKELKTLPTISRSASDFYRLDPTASGDSFGGRNDQFNNFTLDGSIFNNPFGLDAATPGGQTNAQPISLDAIDQIQVSSAPYDVTLSGFTGASINAVTKSGTNEFHGSAYGYFRNQDLTGSKVKGEKIFVPKLEQKQYGFSIGGPIIKNKIFFFANFEKEDRVDLGSNWIPNNGDGISEINESTVLESDMIAVQNALANLGYDTGKYEGFLHDSGSTKGIFKLDFNLNSKHNLSLIYNFLNAFKDKPAHPTALGFRGPSATTLQFENSGYRINNNIQSFLAELNSSFSEKISNKFQIGYTHFDDYRDPFSSPAPVINIQNGGGLNYIIAGHEPFSIHNKLDQRVFQFSDNLTIFLDKHNLTFGMNFEKFMFKNSFNLTAYDNFGTFATHGNYYGNFNAYPDVATFLADAADPNGILVANLAYAQSQYNSLNAAGEGNDGGWKLAELNVGQFSIYGQDEFSINNNFTLTYGLRLDKPLYFNTSDLIQKYIDTDNGATRDNTIDYYDPETGNAVKLISTKLPTDKPVLSPRVGFNWDAKGDKTIQLRGGTGIFTGRFPFVWLGNQVSGADDGFFQILDPDFKWPRVWKTSIGIDNKFKNGLIVSYDLSYTKVIIAALVQNWGLKKPTGTLNGVDNRPIYTPLDKGANNAYVFTNSNLGYALNSTIKFEKAFKKDLYASLAY
ncbi:MAG TPA: TonB-dependent receptor, partial [Flavobacteriia bacterium]|nr:TonB-dependent receptor [Flavobacteriia bacterium]